MLAGAWRRRKTRHLVQGLPSLVCASVIVVTTGLAFHQRPRLLDEYRDAAVAAYRRENFRAAKVYYERLITMDGGLPASQYDLAMTLDHLGQRERAEAIMARLAPIDQPGFPRAQLWLADRLLTARVAGRRDVEAAQRAFRHLLLAQQHLGDSEQLDWGLAQCHVAAGRPEQALPHLMKAAVRMPQLHYELALLAASLGKAELARDALRRADAYYGQQALASPDRDDTRLRWASIRMNRGDFHGAVQVLTEGLNYKPNGPYRQALSTTFVARYDQVTAEDKPLTGSELELLRKALHYDPASQEALMRLMDFGRDGANKQQVEDLLEDLLVTGRENPYVHFVLGSRAWGEKDPQKARWHLERAYRLEEHLGPVANNLAWVLAHCIPPELDRAIEIMNSVVSRWPDNATYRETRGQILAKLQRWPEALDDLELALSGLPRHGELHHTLVEVYRQLGRDELAEKHAQIAASLGTQAKLSSPRSPGPSAGQSGHAKADP